MNVRLIAVVATLLFPRILLAAPSADLGKVGTVHFDDACAGKSKKDFQDAVALLHSFFYEEAHNRFSAIAQKDPSCALAYWGMAMTHYHALWAPPLPSDIEEGTKEADAGLLAARSEKEKAWLGSIVGYYHGPEGAGSTVPSCHGPGPDPKGRAAAWAASMDAMRTKWPKDDEILAFHALSLLATSDPADHARTRQLRAAEELESLYKRQPNHPGAAHYLIHAYDFPELASRGLPAARSYSKIAPVVPHVQHMPSHIFTRLGMWDESMKSNVSSSAAARDYYSRTHPGSTSGEELHADDYLLYAWLQVGDDAKAKALVEKIGAITQIYPATDMSASYAVGSAPARWVLERREWVEAAKLEPKGAAMAKQYSFAAAMVWQARAIGAARSGDLKNARESLARMTEITAGMDAPALEYWKNSVEASRLGASAWVALAEGKKDEAVMLATQAAELEEKWGKHPVTPGATIPERELLGDLLLELGQPEKALVAFEASLLAAPGRMNGLYGAARASDKSGKKDLARKYYGALLDLAKSGDGSRASIGEAKAFLAKHD